MKKPWYENNYRRHLCDMHIADWDDSFLSQFSAEEYLKNLKKANISSAMLYYQSHVGLCYYPTKTAKMHRAFIGKENEMQKLTDLCHENGIAVTGYYSLDFNVWAHDTHPEWRMLMADGHSKRDRAADGQVVDFETAGGSRYGICCPNNEGYVQFVFAQIDEMLDYFRPDGLFFDMLYWPHPCYCPSCLAKWQKETGIDRLPTSNDYNDPVWRLLCERRNAWMGAFAQRVTDYVKSKAPELTVEHNVSAAAKVYNMGTAGAVNRASDFCGGDLSGGLLEESVACKLYRSISMHQPFEYMFPRCEPSLYRHTMTKTPEHMESAIFLAAAHHGATTVIDAIDPVGTLDERAYETIGKVFAKEKVYEPYFRGEPIADIGVAYGLESKGAMRFGNQTTNHTATVGLIGNLVEDGISVGVISRPGNLSQHKMIFASCLWEADAELCDALLQYAKEGGILYIDGPGNDAFIEEATGGKVIGLTDTAVCFVAPKPEYETLFEGFNAKYPLQSDCHVPLIEAPADATVLATLTLPYTVPTETKFASIHSNPPGRPLPYPAVLERNYGKGKIIFSAAPLEEPTYIVYRRIIRNLIHRYVDESALTVRSFAPTDVETVSYRDGSDFLINNVLLLDPKNKPFVPSFNVAVRTERRPKHIELLPQKEEIPFIFEDGITRFQTRETEIFDMYRVKM